MSTLTSKIKNALSTHEKMKDKFFRARDNADGYYRVTVKGTKYYTKEMMNASIKEHLDFTVSKILKYTSK